VRTVGVIFDMFYLMAELGCLMAVVAILYRLRYSLLFVSAPILSVVALTLGLQVWAKATAPQLPLFAFGLILAIRPALALVPPIFIVLVALSPRLSFARQAKTSR
jgi:hypothetical protein